MTYIGNELQWKRLIEVDWLGQYVKAWVTFNAWYSNNFKPPAGKKRYRDRKIIDKIKNDEGNIRSAIEGFLSSDDSDEKLFQSDLANLHKSLSVVVVKSNEKRISFERVTDYEHARPIKKREKYGISYELKVDKDQKKRVITMENTSGTKIFDKIITEAEEEVFHGKDWFENLVKQGYFENLTPTQRNYLKVYLEDSSPIHNLLYSGNDIIEIGPYKFTSDKELIARAIIEILYQLRNALFHGEITPNSEVQSVYQTAYLVLKRIIPGV